MHYNLCKIVNGEPNNSRFGFFNDTLNIFYLHVYGIRHMVKNHSDKKRGNLLLPLHGLLISVSNMGFFICTIPLVVVAASFLSCYMNGSLPMPYNLINVLSASLNKAHPSFLLSDRSGGDADGDNTTHAVT